MATLSAVSHTPSATRQSSTADILRARRGFSCTWRGQLTPRSRTVRRSLAAAPDGAQKIQGFRQGKLFAKKRRDKTAASDFAPQLHPTQDSHPAPPAPSAAFL